MRIQLLVSPRYETSILALRAIPRESKFLYVPGVIFGKFAVASRS